MPHAAHQTRHAETFRALHARAGAFVIPNPWDAGTARLLAMAGFPALATTSAGYAYSRGLPDNAIGRDAMLEHIAVIAAAGGLPVSADLENGFGDAPRSSPRRSGSRRKRVPSADRSRTRPAVPTRRSIRATRRSNGSRPLPRRHARCRFRLR